MSRWAASSRFAGSASRAVACEDSEVACRMWCEMQSDAPFAASQSASLLRARFLSRIPLHHPPAPDSPLKPRNGIARSLNLPGALHVAVCAAGVGVQQD
jgi:hypothetical protein